MKTKVFRDARTAQVERVQAAIESYKQQLAFPDCTALFMREPHHSVDSQAVDALSDADWLRLRRAVLRGGIEALQKRLAEDRPWPFALRPIAPSGGVEVDDADG